MAKKGIRKISGTKNLTEISSKNGNNFIKIHKSAMSFCLEVGLMVISKYLHVKIQDNTSKGIGNKWSGTKKWYKNVNGNSMFKKGHKVVKINDRIMSTSKGVGIMATNKYIKFHSNTWKGIGNKWVVSYNKLTGILSIHNFVKIQDESYDLLHTNGVNSH